MARSRYVAAVVVLAVGLGCGSQGGSDPSSAASGTSSVISDQAHGGNAGFSFLPPTVLSAPPAATGPFDPNVRAVVRVCKGTGACDARSALASFSSSGGTGGGPLATLRASEVLQAYTAVWDTRRCSSGSCALVAGASYRLHVYALTPENAELELGFADLMVIAGALPRTLDTRNFSPIVKNLPYVIAFRIEQHPRPPSVRILSPTDGSATSTGSMAATVEFAAGTDLLTGRAGSVGDVDLLVNGALVATQRNSPAVKSGTRDFAVDLSGFPDQVLTLQAQAYQGSRTAGLRGDSAPVRVVLDRTPPAVAFRAPAPMAVSLNQGVVGADVAYADELAGVAAGGVHLTLDGVEVSSGLTSPGDGSVAYLPASTLGEGAHTYAAWAVDRAGNVSALAQVTFDVAFGAGAARIGPDGGLVTVDQPESPLFGISLSVPAGAVTTSAVFKLVPLPEVTSPTAIGGLEGVSLPAFEIVPHVEGLATPLTIRLPLPDADRDGVVDGSGFPVENAHLFYRRAAGDDWTRVDTRVDVAGGFIEAQALHTSQWVPGYFRWPTGTCIALTVAGLPADHDGGVDSFTALSAREQLTQVLDSWSAALQGRITFSTSGCPAGSPQLALDVQDNSVAIDRGNAQTYPASAGTGGAGPRPVWIRVASTSPYPDGTPGTQFYTDTYPVIEPYLAVHTPWQRTLLHEVGHFLGLADYSASAFGSVPLNPEQWNVCAPPGSFSPLSGGVVMFRDFDCGEGLPLTQLGRWDLRKIAQHYGFIAVGDATFDAVTLSSTDVPLDGYVGYTGLIDNRTRSTMTSVFIQGWIEQGAALRAASGAQVWCGAGSGVFPPGTCSFSGGLRASNTGGGTGTLVPGGATGVLEVGYFTAGGVRQILDTYRVAIRLLPPLTHGISGSISGPLASGVTVRLDGAGTAVTATDANGRYSFSGLVDGNYTVTPELTGYTFAPTSRAVALRGADVVLEAFAEIRSCAADPQVTISGFGQPVALAVADFDGDGVQDLSVASYNMVSVVLGRGDGTFDRQTNVRISVNAILAGLAVGDFDQDGRPDLAVADRSGSLTVLLGAGNGTFRSSATYPIGGINDANAVAVADLDRDGHLDLVTTNATARSLSVLLGRGDGTFAARRDFPAGTSFQPVSVAVGDFDGDGVLDLVAPNSLAVSVLPGLGDGTFGAPIGSPVSGYPERIAVADLDGDGRLDLAFTTNSGSRISVYPGTGDGRFTSRRDYPLPAAPQAVVAVDLTGDGRLDLATANYDAGTVSVLAGAGDGTFSASVEHAAGAYALSLAVGDFDRDGMADLAVANGNANTVSVLLGGCMR